MDSGLTPAASMLLALLMLASLALLWGGAALIRRGNRQKGVLMLVCALVLAGNVAIWTV